MIALHLRRPVLATLKVAGDLDKCVCQAVAAPTDAPGLSLDSSLFCDPTGHSPPPAAVWAGGELKGH